MTHLLDKGDRFSERIARVNCFVITVIAFPTI
jgi:hypothetical protein